MTFRLKQSLNCGGSAAAFILVLAVSQLASAAAKETILYDFGVVKGGHYPAAAPTLGPDGAYYGTASSGGATGNGAVYKFVPPAAGGQAWTETLVYSFSGTDGASPTSGLLLGKEGAFYGVAATGGDQGAGTIFELSPPAAGATDWSLTTLHSFNGTSDGNAPFGTLVEDSHGVLYGSTANGGTGQGGVVFSLTPPPAGQTVWTETVLYSFQFGADGISPTAGVYRDAASGDIYGMTSGGGLNNAGQIYRLTPSSVAGTPWTKASLYSFRAITDGNYPVGGLVRDQDGTFYGATDAGGLTGWGTVFSYVPPGAGNKNGLETVLYHFSGRLDGGAPNSTLVEAPDGTLYGTSNAGGNVGSGTVFALTPQAKGKAWTEKALVSFDGPNGTNPAGVALDAEGTLIGTTFYGGTLGDGGGTIFTLAPPAAGESGWTQIVQHQFRGISTDADYPLGALLVGKGGVMYGSANSGGAHGDGAVYALAPPPAGKKVWQRTILHGFDGRDGSQPEGKLVEGSNGVLYGVTTSGGDKDPSASYGTVYSLTPPVAGQTAWAEKVLHVFKGVSAGDGAFPAAGLIADANGALYGTAGSGGIASSDDTFGNGIVFKLSPPAAGKTVWKETILYSFTGPDGSTPQGSLLFDSAGALYGTTYTGGAEGEGAVFKLTPPAGGSSAWTETLLHSFNAAVGNDGAIPGTEQLVMDAKGVLYGTASQGGANNDGAVFALAPPAAGGTDWTETILHSFTGADGISPYVGLLANRNGALFGVTQQGGAYQYYGTVFKLAPPAKGTDWKFTLLHSFDPAYGQDGADASGALIQDAKGALYGTAASGGYGDSGVVFKITP